MIWDILLYYLKASLNLSGRKYVNRASTHTAVFLDFQLICVDQINTREHNRSPDSYFVDIQGKQQQATTQN